MPGPIEFTGVPAPLFSFDCQTQDYITKNDLVIEPAVQCSFIFLSISRLASLFAISSLLS